MNATTSFTIDKGIPLPEGAGGKGAAPKYPFAKMEVGDSFFIPGAKASAVSSKSGYYRKRGMKFCTRQLVENGVSGCRVWRLV